jgi:tetratricopeptide (TPR) repeat protein
MEVHMNVKLLALAGAAFLPAAAAASGLTVIGASPAATNCYRAADSSGAPNADALAACDQALTEAALRYEHRIATHVNRGIVRFRMGQLDGAHADFDAVLAREPRQPDALINKGIVTLASGGDIEAAMVLLDQGLAGSPQRPWVGYYGRAVAHELAGRDALAYRDYKKAAELKPGWSLARAALARFGRG